MIANPTTLIVGAGASKECGYPTGRELRDLIIKGEGLDSRVTASRNWKQMVDLFRRSLVPSIDAFLAEIHDPSLRDVGLHCIASALLPCETKSRDQIPDWIQQVFESCRGRGSAVRQHRLKIVTFNYDLSLEHFLLNGFQATYSLSDEEALERLNTAVEIIHVYGQLGDPAGDQLIRSYGAPITVERLHAAQKGIKIIGRGENAAQFQLAQKAIESAEFVGILGFGYDETNIENLGLTRLLSGKHCFSSGFEMGYGMRGWIRHIGLRSIVIGSCKHGTGAFLRNSGLLKWANTIGVSANDMRVSIHGRENAENVEYYS